ncbi:hypothetical protein KAX75_06470 [candidate division WOR-3 bacterium]|nr:hypothetical protein [candidate division WOR-3 bacterium]
MLSLYLSGCAHSPKRFLPPISENKYPIIVGIISSKDESQIDINSVLVNIISNSGLTAGVLNEPFNKEMVDVIVAVKNVSISKTKSGIFPWRWRVQGELSLDVFDYDDNLIGSYIVKESREGKSFLPIFINYEIDILISELVINAIENFALDLENRKIEAHHTVVKEEKVSKSDVIIHYPVLTDFRRKTISVKTTLQGNVPPDMVEIEISKNNNAPFLTQQLYFSQVKNINNHKEWLYCADIINAEIPLNDFLEYRIISKDIMKNENVVEKGNLRTISKGLFRLKQTEVLTHGVILTTFSGLVVIMLLYSF